MASITATFGTVEYREGGVIAIPLNFAADAIVPSKSICRITRVSGSDLIGVNYRITGKKRAFEVVVEVPPDRKGSFSIAINSTVLNASTRKWDTVTVAAKTITYDTREPKLINYDIPADYTLGEIFDVILQYEPECTVNDPVAHFGDADANYLDFFIFEGANLGTPNLYRKIDNTYPTGPIGTVSDTDKKPPTADWSDQNLQTTDATIYLLRWEVVNSNAIGIFNLTPKAGFVRGPVS